MWAIKDQEMDVYYAESQFRDGITISSFKGNPPFYRPMRFKTKEDAQKVLDRIKGKDPKWQWGIVELMEDKDINKEKTK